MKLSRRFFLKSSGIALVGLGAVPGFLARAAVAMRARAERYWWCCSSAARPTA